MKFFVVLFFALCTYQMVIANPHRESGNRDKRQLEWLKNAWEKLKEGFVKVHQFFVKVQEKSKKYIGNIKSAYETSMERLEKSLHYCSKKLEKIKSVLPTQGLQDAVESIERRVNKMIAEMDKAREECEKIGKETFDENTSKTEQRISDVEQASNAEKDILKKTLLDAVTNGIARAKPCTDTYSPKAEELHKKHLSSLRACTDKSLEDAKALWAELKDTIQKSTKFIDTVKSGYEKCRPNFEKSCLTMFAIMNAGEIMVFVGDVTKLLTKVKAQYDVVSSTVYECCKNTIDNGKSEWKELTTNVKQCLGFN